MNVLQKNWLLQNKHSFQKSIQYIFILYALLFPCFSNSQIANFVGNGGFEDAIDCSLPANISKAKYWNSIDSISTAALYCNICPGIGNIPNCGFTFQFPKDGNAFALSNFLCEAGCNPTGSRFYLKNRLLSNLKNGTTYCVKFYVNISDNATYGIDAIGAYFGDNYLDTITKCDIPLTYLMPQVQNANNNIITDTLNWIAITGTFVAVGNEKFMVIGNFKSAAATHTILINPTNLPTVATDICIDDVSCIELNLPAYAGPDKSVVPGDSVYIGREPDFEIDKGCIWYKLPNTTMAIDTGSGLWVKPVITSTYVVRQVLDCSTLKWDTVVVYIDPVGIVSSSRFENEIKLFPNPTNENLELKINNEELISSFKTLYIYNSLGQIIREQDLLFENKKTIIKTDDLSEGVYLLQLKSENSETVYKRFVISR
jgi:hypothetical protein